jgi:hypothetical protein
MTREQQVAVRTFMSAVRDGYRLSRFHDEYPRHACAKALIASGIIELQLRVNANGEVLAFLTAGGITVAERRMPPRINGRIYRHRAP